ncbi:MAG TPA: hypothetical protein V6D17_23940 [Candidatus Obscuribacterales bacterium]
MHEAELWWGACLQAMESIFGPADNSVLRSPVPFDAGFEAGGRANVLAFRKTLSGVAYATCELIGRDDQVHTPLGNYELVICHRQDDSWGPNLISSLAYYTLQASLNPGETMSLPPEWVGDGTVKALLFLELTRMTVRNRQCGLLVCRACSTTWR